MWDNDENMDLEEYYEEQNKQLFGHYLNLFEDPGSHQNQGKFGKSAHEDVAMEVEEYDDGFGYNVSQQNYSATPLSNHTRILNKQNFSQQVSKDPVIAMNKLASSNDEFDDDFFEMEPDQLEVEISQKTVENSCAVNKVMPTAHILQPAKIPNNRDLSSNKFRAVSEIPLKYRSIFTDIPSFNAIQSKVLDTVMRTDSPVVVAAPTGSGKTVVFELAIVKLLQTIESEFPGWNDFKIVYMAPIKALCSERMADWSKKFGPLGIKCTEITGDMEQKYYSALRDNQIILTTPEKWDSMTRHWKDNSGLVQHVKLILIDEVHLLNEEKRGPILEAVISRMKTIELSLECRKTKVLGPRGIRFLAVSATIPNVKDVAKWLNFRSAHPAQHFSLAEDQRPVQLKKIVIGYDCQKGWSPFRFDMQLTYRLKEVLIKYSDGKPCLVFCSTRKSVTHAVATLVKDLKLGINSAQKGVIMAQKEKLVDKKIGDGLVRGIGIHHAGIHKNDRIIVENLFRLGVLPVLVATSTLAMGVNLPAHLVVIKSTEHYINNAYAEYNESSILQMMGRAGRPQFDTSATAVIMTKNSEKAKYDRLLGGRQLVESTLHKHLAEHLNAEVVLQTITDISLALEWLKSTFLFVRAVENPKTYGLKSVKVEDDLKDLCLKGLKALDDAKVVQMDGLDVVPTEAGKIMAKYYISLNSMKLIMKELKEGSGLDDILRVLSLCDEFNDHNLRVMEKRTLNELNKKIKFKQGGKVQKRETKINVLVQASLGCLQHQDISLHQETSKIMQIAKRLAKCICEYVSCTKPYDYFSVLNSTLLSKSTEKSLWPDSEFVARQFDGIGPKYSENLVSAGKTSFQAIRVSNPRDLERIMGVATARGNYFLNAAARLPMYALNLVCSKVNDDTLKLELSCLLTNIEDLNKGKTAGQKHSALLLLADKTENQIIYSEKILDSFLMNNTYLYSTEYSFSSKGDTVEIVAHLISETWVGIDVETSFSLELPKKESAKEEDATNGCKTSAKKTSAKGKAKSQKNPPDGQKTPGRKRKPSVCTQTLDKYKLVTKTPIKIKKLQRQAPVSIVKPAVQQAPIKSVSKELVYCPGPATQELMQNEDWADEEPTFPTTPLHQPSICSPSYSPLYSPSTCSISTVGPSPPKEKKRYILNYPLPVLSFDVELESEDDVEMLEPELVIQLDDSESEFEFARSDDEENVELLGGSEDEFELSPFGNAKLPELKSFSGTQAYLPCPPICKRSLSPVRDANSLIDTVIGALGTGVTPRISTYLNHQKISFDRTFLNNSTASGFVMPKVNPAPDEGWSFQKYHAMGRSHKMMPKKYTSLQAPIF